VSIAKISLHAGGYCYFSFTSQRHAQMVARGAARTKRAFTRWQRLPTPQTGSVNVASLLFAAEYLSRNGTPVEPDTTLIRPPRVGQAIAIDLLFARRGRISPQSNQREVGNVALSTGEELFIIAGLVNDFDAQAVHRHHQPFSDDTEIGFFEEPEGVDPDALRGVIMLPARNDGVLRIVEIGPTYVS
jgi:hypothetical protein